NYQLPMPHAPCPMPYSQFPTFLWQQYVKMLNPVLYVFPKRTIGLEDFVCEGYLRTFLHIL
ncbi:MAG: hypothetical protein WBF90_31195, partial [Rivularia sp. (in: cyanobacteria)]